MHIAKKLTALTICLQLTSAPIVCAQVAQPSQKVPQKQIEQTISKTDPYRTISLVALGGWVTAGCALGVMIRKAYKNAKMTPQQQIEKISAELHAGVASKSIAPSYVTGAANVMKNEGKAFLKDEGYFFKYYQVLPSTDPEATPFWEKSYTKNGGVLPEEFNAVRSSASKLASAADAAHYSLPYKQGKQLNTLILEINDNFYKLHSLTSSDAAIASKLSAKIQKDVKALVSLSKKLGVSEVQQASTEFSAQVLKELQFSDFRIALSDMQGQLARSYATAGNKEGTAIAEIVQTINSKLMAARTAQNKAEAQKLLTEVEAEGQRLAVAATNAQRMGMQEAIEGFLKQVTKELKGKGGVLGAGAVLVAGTALMVIASSSAQAATVSNNRVLVQRELASSFQNTPDVFAVTVVNAKEKYGLGLVSSVIYEHQEYYPLLAQQIEIMTAPQSKECLEILVKGKTSDYKADLIKGLKTK